MKQYRMLFAFLALMLAVSLACGSGSSTTTAPVVATNTKASALPNPPSNPSGNTSNSTGSSDLTTFVDKNNLLAFDLPSNWVYKNVPGDVYYTDVFTAPDESAKIESLVYNDGKAFSGTDNGRFALYLLNTYYSNTGKEGDIRVSTDQIMNDGSERLEWTSRGGGYQGVSFFELRGNDKLTFLMLTAWWSNNTEQATLDIVNNAIGSYHVP